MKYFKGITDPRTGNKVWHKLIDIIILAICAVICGADKWDEIEEFGKSKHEFLKEILELPNGIPSHDTIARMFARIDPEEFKNSFVNWIKEVSEITNGEIVAIDGKTLRRSYDGVSNKSAIHMISAWANRNRIVLGQRKTDDKSNEITAIPELIKILDLKNSIVTIDAIGCQKDIAKLIIKKEADYVLALKKNQKLLYEDVKLFFEKEHEYNLKDVNYDFYKTSDKGHGRIEKRKYWIVSDIQWLNNIEGWKGLKCVGMVEAERTVKGQTSKERRYYITSLECDAKKFAEAVRSHWGIENSLHWVLDIAFREDESRIRKDNSPENFAVLRHIALCLLKKETLCKRRSLKKTVFPIRNVGLFLFRP